MTFRRVLAVCSVSLLAALGVAPQAAAAPAVQGACGVNEGVTVVVDFAPTDSRVDIGCAPGAQASIGAALEAAGFSLTSEVTGFGNYLCAIDEVAANPADCQAFPGAYWSGLINTTDGNPGGPFGTAWTPANVGIDVGPVPVPVGTVIGYVQNTDGSWPGPTPGVDLADLPAPDNSPVEPPSYGPGEGSAAEVAGWLGRQLAAGNGLINGSVGLSVDAIYALAAAGVGGDQIVASGTAVQVSAESYMGTPAEIADKFAAVAKVALALQIAGFDPTAFPGAAGDRDLLAEIRSVLNADGSFGSYDDPFLHSFALLALARTAAGVPDVAVGWLEQQQCTDPAAAGAFGYAGCASADPDYTAVAVQGLLGAGVPADAPTVVAALDWLQQQQAADGGIAGNTNSTGLGGQALLAGGRPDAAAISGTYIGGLQISCDTVPGTALTAADVGAVAWQPASLADAVQFGIDDGNLGQFQYASVQAVFGLGAPSFGELTAAGAAAGLPVADDCTVPQTSVPTSVPTSAPTATLPNAAPSTADTVPAATAMVPAPGPELATTGVGPHTGAEAVIAALLILTGSALMLAARRARGRAR